jgi:rhodanese-related sulfurtransferase
MRPIGFLFILLLIFPALAFSYISVSEARQMAEKGEAIIIDVRQQLYYEEGHIPGALLMSLDNLEELVRSGRAPVATSDMLILYCDCPEEESSLMAASILEHYGFSRIYVMRGGWQAWKDSGFPIMAGKEQGSLKKTSIPYTPHPITTQAPPIERSNSPPILLLAFLILSLCAVGIIFLSVYFTNRR